MRLYHPPIPASRNFLVHILSAAILLLQAGCALPEPTPASISVSVLVDGETQTINLPLDSTVQNALDAAQVELEDLDQVDPPAFSFLSDGSTVTVVRVTEEIFDKEEIIPFEKQTIKNESMPEGESRIVQVGVNGVEIITWRRLFEDGVEASLQVLRRTTQTESMPEIVMVGSQSPFASFPVPGRLAYLLGGSAWVIEERTGSRRPIVTTGDLDGRIFSLSPDGQWLLFTRKAKEADQINTLWAARADPDGAGILVDLEAANVIHFAAWSPVTPMVVAYSTVEPRPSAPGWQANNDLRLVRISGDGQISPVSVELDTNMGGNYGWWGMDFAWSPDGARMAYARPDNLGMLNLGLGETETSLNNLLDITALQTGSDWAWVPGVTWGPDNTALFTVDHALDPASVSPEESQIFDLLAVPLTGGAPVRLSSQVGMFAYPLASPLMVGSAGQPDYLLAYLHAIFPTQSETSRYRLALIDRDGSNPRVIFPDDGAPGMDPLSHWGAWSPDAVEEDGYALAVIYQNNLWIVNIKTGEARQITGDNLVTRVDWK